MQMHKILVNDPALKGGACDSPEVRMIAEAVSFLKVGSHCRGVDSTLTTTGVPRSYLSPGTQFPGGAGSWRQSDHRSIGNGIVDMRSGVGAYHNCLGPHARILGRFARCSGDLRPLCALDVGRLYIRAFAGAGKTPRTRTCIDPVAGLAPWLPESPSDPPARTASAPHSGPRVPY